MLEASHTILNGKVHLYRRGGEHWHCATYLKGKNRRTTTKTDSLSQAKEIAEDWYLSLRGRDRAGLISNEKTFKQAADQFVKEYGIITEGQRSPRWVEGHNARLRLHLIPFFGDLRLSQVTPGKVQEYRVHRATTPPVGSKKPAGKTPPPYKAPARSTLHDEVVTLRLVLKTAVRHEWLTHLPDLSPPYRTQGKIVHRPWFSPEEYKQLFEATRAYASAPAKEQFKWNAEQVHDYVLFMANTGLRPDEAKNLQHRDVTVAVDDATGQKILEIEVRGKRGVGYCKSTPEAVWPYEQRLLKRPKYVPHGRKPRSRKAIAAAAVALAAKAPEPPQLPQPTDPVFPGNHIKLFNALLARAKLKKDRDGNARTAYSLRHTYICMRLMEGADIYQIAKNCRTSVEMIEKFYAAHLKHTLDAAAINVRKPKPWKRKPEGAQEGDD
jgi:integrase